MTKKELFEKFKPKTKEIEVKSWDGMKVEIRELSVSEVNDIQASMLEGATLDEISNGKVNISIGKLEEAKTVAVSKALVKPKLTVVEINELGATAKDGISEIYDAIKEMEQPKK